jgi:D-3-phosphoglycerate dehydrogenase / 2-oxoglutarate reductase
MHKVLVTDHTFDPLDVERAALEPLGGILQAHQCKTPEHLLPLVADADAVLTQFAPIDARVVAAMNRVRVIVRYGIGVDNVDLDAARARGIAVCNVPEYCLDEVADHTLAFILALTRQVVPNCLHLRAGRWSLGAPLAAMRTLREMTVGVVGFGRIGREVVRRLLAFRGRVLVFDPIVGAAEIEHVGATPVASLDALLAECDLLTLHCPSTARTRRMIDATALAKMKRGALLVNLARGDVVDTAALVAALELGQLAGAALDVCDPEPIPPDHTLLRLSNVIVTPHIASASCRALRRLREEATDTVVRALRGEPLSNVVNGVPNPR